MKTYSVLNSNYETLFSTKSFDKDIITSVFEAQIRAALYLKKEGEEIMFGFSDEKYCSGPSLVVEIRNGKAMLQVIKGTEVFYKDYQFKTAA